MSDYPPSDEEFFVAATKLVSDHMAYTETLEGLIRKLAFGAEALTVEMTPEEYHVLTEILGRSS